MVSRHQKERADVNCMIEIGSAFSSSAAHIMLNEITHTKILKPVRSFGYLKIKRNLLLKPVTNWFILRNYANNCPIIRVHKGRQSLALTTDLLSIQSCIS